MPRRAPKVPWDKLPDDIKRGFDRARKRIHDIFELKRLLRELDPDEIMWKFFADAREHRDHDIREILSMVRNVVRCLANPSCELERMGTFYGFIGDTAGEDSLQAFHYACKRVDTAIWAASNSDNERPQDDDSVFQFDSADPSIENDDDLLRFWRCMTIAYPLGLLYDTSGLDYIPSEVVFLGRVLGPEVLAGRAHLVFDFLYGHDEIGSLDEMWANDSIIRYRVTDESRPIPVLAKAREVLAFLEANIHDMLYEYKLPEDFSVDARKALYQSENKVSNTWSARSGAGLGVCRSCASVGC